MLTQYFLLFLIYKINGHTIEDVQARLFLNDVNKKLEKLRHEITVAKWDYQCNLNDRNLEIFLKEKSRYTIALETLIDEVKKNFSNKVTNTTLKRQFEKLSFSGVFLLDVKKFLHLVDIVKKMTYIYSTAKICEFSNRTNCCDLDIETGVKNVFSNSRNLDELKHYWVKTREKTHIVKDMYKEHVDILNEVAKLNNLSNGADVWLRDYEDPLFMEHVENLLRDVWSFYLEIHAYVRNKLRKFYGETVPVNGPIPAHILGNLWAESWENIFSITAPYPHRTFEDVTKSLKEKSYTVLGMVKTAEKFFTSIGLFPMTNKFWENSIFERPPDKVIDCQTSSWDFYEADDFRTKMCAEVNEENFHAIHNEIAHMEYFMSYKNQPPVFRAPANPGFYEAVGYSISLSVGSHTHLSRLDLTQIHDYTDEDVINDLYRLALMKVVFLPYAYVLDRWRWDVFAGKISPDDYNCKWWELREKYQGIEPPVDRTVSDFDPAAKYHVMADIQYISYFVSYLAKFQFYRALCEAAGQYDYVDPNKRLFKCDIYGNTKAGNILKKMLEMGSSQPWTEAMKSITGQKYMEANSLLEFFKPLRDWLEKENKRTGTYIGWKPSNKKFGCRKDFSQANSAAATHSIILISFISTLLVPKL